MSPSPDVRTSVVHVGSISYFSSIFSSLAAIIRPSLLQFSGENISTSYTLERDFDVSFSCVACCPYFFIFKQLFMCSRCINCFYVHFLLLATIASSFQFWLRLAVFQALVLRFSVFLLHCVIPTPGFRSLPTLYLWALPVLPALFRKRIVFAYNDGA